MSRSEILVTGGGGLLGTALRPLLPQARFLTRKDCDLRDGRAVDRLFSETRPERAVHLAARVGGVRENAAHNAELLEDNVLINANVLRAARAVGTRHVVSILSSCAYEFYPDRPSFEEDLHAGLPFGGNLGYGYSKRLLDVHSRLLWEQGRIRASTVTPVTMYGPGDNFDLESGHVAASLIRKALAAKREGGPLEVWGTGNAVRQFVFAADIAKLVVDVLEGAGEPDRLIAAPDAGITIRDLAQAVAKAAEFSGPLVFDAAKPEGAPRRVLESRSLARRFPGRRWTPLAEGLRATVRWLERSRPDLLPAKA